MKNNDALCGVLCVNKEKNFTSMDCVSVVRKLFNLRAVGHTGTLDPMATGVLPIMLGRSVKASEYLCCDDKIYRATVQLGLTTDTEDITGTVLTRSDFLPSEKEVFKTVKRFVGKIKQIPPMYSAIQVGGKRLYDLAREGKEVAREAREIEIFSLDIQTVNEQTGVYEMEIACSKGTYIRTLCADIGKALGCGATLTELCRLKSGEFSIKDALSLKEIEALPMEKRLELLKPTQELFLTLREVRLSNFYATLMHNGCEIYCDKIKLSLPVGERVRVCDKDGFFALGEVKAYEKGLAIKAVKLFRL